MDRTEKREFVTELNQALAATSMIVVTRNAGLTVAEVTDLRRKMGAAGATLQSRENRLTNLALDGTPFDGIKSLLKGPIALAWRRTRWLWQRPPSSSPRPTRSSCSSVDRSEPRC